MKESRDREFAAIAVPTQGISRAPPLSSYKNRGQQKPAHNNKATSVLKEFASTVPQVTPKKTSPESDDDTVVDSEILEEAAVTTNQEESPPYLDSSWIITPKKSAFIPTTGLFQEDINKMGRAPRSGAKAYNKLKKDYADLEQKLDLATQQLEVQGANCQSTYLENEKLRDTVATLKRVPKTSKAELVKLAAENGKLKANLQLIAVANKDFSVKEQGALEENKKLRAADLEHVHEKKRLNAKIQDLEKQIKEQQALIQSKTHEKAMVVENVDADAKLAKEVEDHLKRIRILEKLVEKLRKIVDEYKQAMQSGKKSVPSECSKTGCDKIRDYCRDVCIIDTPFVTSQEEKEGLIKRIYDGIKDDSELQYSNVDDPDSYMDQEEFARVYGDECVVQLNQQRQNIVTKLRIAATGKFPPLQSCFGSFNPFKGCFLLNMCTVL